MTDITELAQSLKAAAENAIGAHERLAAYPYGEIIDISQHEGEQIDIDITDLNEFNKEANPVNILALVEALEKAQTKAGVYDMLRDDYGLREKGVGLADFVDWQAKRIAELEESHAQVIQSRDHYKRISEEGLKQLAESRTVKLPVHPTVASENLDDETLQELIEFRRTTFEYHSKEGNKVQTIIHGVTLAALRELQERRKADSEPVAEVVSIYGDPEAFGEREIRPLVGIQQMPYGTKLYLHAQPVVEIEPMAEVLSNRPGNDTSTIDRALPVGTQLYRHAQPAPVVPKSISVRQAISALESVDAVTTIGQAYKMGWNACRAAMLQELKKSAGTEATCRSNENVQAVEVQSLTSINPAPDLVSLQKKAESIIGNYPGIPDCWCRTCRPVVLNDMRFVVCPDCGNKRCPRANDHRNACTGSNEPGQEGSAYPDTPQEVKGE